jgi:hypothetical protein
MTHRHGILALIVTVMADRAITLSFWQLESNPVVTSLGPVPWLVLTVACLAVMTVAWYRWGIHRYQGMVPLVALLTAAHGLAVVTNAAVVLS